MKEEQEEHSGYRRDGFLYRSVRQLRLIASYLNMFGVVLLAFTVAHIAVVALSLRRTSAIIYFFDLPIFSAAMFIIVTTLALVFDVCRRRGDTLYEAVSDGFKSSSSSSGPDINFDDELMHEARYSLRNFDKASDLPLLPGKFGPAILVGTNLILLILVITRVSNF